MNAVEVRHNGKLLFTRYDTLVVSKKIEKPMTPGSMLEIAALPIMEAVNANTADHFRPLDLREQDRLELRLDDEGKRFLAETRYYINGERQEESESWRRSSDARFRWFLGIPEHFVNPKAPERHYLAATDFTALIIHHRWPFKQIVFLDEGTEMAYKFLLTRFLVQTKNAIQGARFKVEKTVPDMPEDYIEHPELPLADYQKAAMLMSLEQTSFALFMQQGTGKTPTAIARMCLEAQRTRMGKYPNPAADQPDKRCMKVLIICPKQVRKNWETEIGRFTVCPGKVTTLRGIKNRRIKGLIDALRTDEDCFFSAVISGFEQVKGSWELISKIPWDLCIVDESHYIKNGEADRTKHLHILRDMCERVMILTGTPITNTPFDLWSQFEMMGDGLSGFNVFKNFRSFYGVFTKKEAYQDKSRGSFEKMTGLRNLPLIQERLARLSFSITKKEADMQLPEKTRDMIEVTMTSQQREIYAKVASQLLIEMENADSSSSLTVEHMLTRILRLTQVTSGHIKWDPVVDEDTGCVLKEGYVEQIDGGNPKVDATVEAVKTTAEADPDCKTLIWAVFIEDIKAIEKRCKEEGIDCVTYYGGTKEKDRDEAVRRFNCDPACKVFIGNPATAGTGLNLLGYDWTLPEAEWGDSYTGHEIFFSQNWSVVQRSQAEDRAHRRGTRRNVRITDLVVPGTIDEEIRQRVVVKRAVAQEIQDIKLVLETVMSDFESVVD